MKRQVYIALFIAIFASTMGVGFIGPLLPFYARSLGATGLTIGLIFSGFSLARFVFMPFIGRLSDRFGRKRFITTGLAIVTLFSLAYLKVDSIGSLLVVRFLHGAASGMVVPVAQAYIGDIAPKGREGSVMGTFMVFLFTAFGIGPLLAGPLADRFGLVQSGGSDFHGSNKPRIRIGTGNGTIDVRYETWQRLSERRTEPRGT